MTTEDLKKVARMESEVNSAMVKCFEYFKGNLLMASWEIAEANRLLEENNLPFCCLLLSVMAMRPSHRMCEAMIEERGQNQ